MNDTKKLIFVRDDRMGTEFKCGGCGEHYYFRTGSVSLLICKKCEEGEIYIDSPSLTTTSEV